MVCLQGNLGFWTLINGKYIEAFLPYENFVALAKKNLIMQKKDAKHIDKILAECEKKSRLLYDLYKKLELINISQLHLKQVQELLKKLDRLNYDYWCKIYFCDLYDPNGEELLKQELEKENVKLSDKETSIMLKTSWLNYAQEERLALLNIAQLKLKNLPQDKTQQLIKEHTHKYFYINNSWESTILLDEAYFTKKLDEIKNPDQEITRLTTNWELEHKKIQQKHNLSDNIMNVFYYFRQLSILRDKRKKHTLLTNHYYDLLMKRIYKLHDLPFEKMGVIRVEDITKEINQTNLLNLIAQRKNLFLEIYTPEKSTFFSGVKAVGIYNLLQKSYGQVGNLRGLGACKGKVQGIVRVILGETHFSKFNEGDILVAPMTRPEFVPLMKKASAVITDEGGITCHAAIISREMNIPCIVGTQKATSKLKDGMLVEVNADNGIVKVIRHLKLLSVQSLVDKELEKNPNLIEILKEGLLNITAAAEKFKPSISQQIGKEIKVHAISMAIRRYAEKNIKKK
ncbi:TPA: hypothetical protein HA246_06300 [Candidatus Woesearchaeota archaeon]|nr:hypothetical protein [Candidatus Woesearchaeota archaeon]